MAGSTVILKTLKALLSVFITPLQRRFMLIGHVDEKGFLQDRFIHMESFANRVFLPAQFTTNK